MKTIAKRIWNIFEAFIFFDNFVNMVGIVIEKNDTYIFTRFMTLEDEIQVPIGVFVYQSVYLYVHLYVCICRCLII